MRKNKKVDVKKVAKLEVMNVIEKALIEAGYETSRGETYGMTEGTLIVGHDTCDIQIKPITPKAGVTRYEPIPDED